MDLVRTLADDGDIGLDPCSNEYSMVLADEEYSLDNGKDGLLLGWRGFGLVFMNPPHSLSPHNIEPWMEKAYREFVEKELTDDQFIALVPSKTDTGWFHDHASQFNLRCFLKGRYKYWLNGNPTEGPGRFAQMVIYHGKKHAEFYNTFHKLGWIR